MNWVEVSIWNIMTNKWNMNFWLIEFFPFSSSETQFYDAFFTFISFLGITWISYDTKYGKIEITKIEAVLHFIEICISVKSKTSYLS